MVVVIQNHICKFKVLLVSFAIPYHFSIFLCQGIYSYTARIVSL